MARPPILSISCHCLYVLIQWNRFSLWSFLLIFHSTQHKHPDGAYFCKTDSESNHTCETFKIYLRKEDNDNDNKSNKNRQKHELSLTFMTPNDIPVQLWLFFNDLFSMLSNLFVSLLDFFLVCLTACLFVLFFVCLLCFVWLGFFWGEGVVSSIFSGEGRGGGGRRERGASLPFFCFCFVLFFVLRGVVISWDCFCLFIW